MWWWFGIMVTRQEERCKQMHHRYGSPRPHPAVYLLTSGLGTKQATPRCGVELRGNASPIKLPRLSQPGGCIWSRTSFTALHCLSLVLFFTMKSNEDKKKKKKKNGEKVFLPSTPSAICCFTSPLKSLFSLCPLVFPPKN